MTTGARIAVRTGIAGESRSAVAAPDSVNAAAHPVHELLRLTLALASITAWSFLACIIAGLVEW